MGIDINKINEEIEAVLKLIEKETNSKRKYELLEDLESLRKIKSNILDEPEEIDEEYENLSSEYAVITMEKIKEYCVKNKAMLMKIVSRTIDTFDTTKFLLLKEEIYQRIFSLSEVLDIIYSYFSSYNDEVYRYIKSLIENKQVAMGDYPRLMITASVFPVKSQKKNYIICNTNTFETTSSEIGDYTLNDIFNLVHELSHCEYFNFPFEKKDDDKLYGITTIFSEVPPSFSEFNFLEHIKKQRITDDHVILENKILGQMRVGIGEIESYFEYIDSDEKIGTTMEDYDLHEGLLYGMGARIAFELHLKYIKDKEEVIKRYRDFCAYNGYDNFQKLLLMLGIEKGTLYNTKELKKTIIKHNEDIQRLGLK